jgi:conjugal transfer pilus assembly protein TraU
MKYLPLLALLLSEAVSAGSCGAGGFLNPVTDVNWNCIFPVRIGGVATISVDAPPDPEEIANPICTCDTGGVPRVGLSVSFWEPAKIIDVVTTPYCFPSFGTQLGSTDAAKAGGIVTEESGTSKLFAQTHWITFPAWAILDLFMDIPCLEGVGPGQVPGMAIDAMSELNPIWNDDSSSLIFNPEAVVFANPASQSTCIADSVSANVGRPIDALFWCMGSWGNAYPLAGSITEGGDMVEAAAGLAARRIYFAGREGATTGGALGLLDTGVSFCHASYTPIWQKSHYRVQLAKPIKDHSCRAIGEDGTVKLWSMGKNPVNNGDNFSFVMFRKVKCCLSY